MGGAGKPERTIYDVARLMIKFSLSRPEELKQYLTDTGFLSKYQKKTDV